MRIALCVTSILFGAYAFLSAIFVAQSGVTDGVSQLIAAGGAECVVGILAFVAAALLFWQWWMSVACFLANAAWSIVIALFYLDETVWLWCLASVIFAILTWLFHRKSQQITRVSPVQSQSRTQQEATP